ncbi:hypothetical protein [Streptomyces sp. NPDC057748]|uniref:hypothetical protein n=1 Tax=unclassified Streptomyces TaxID=2593676 RepID=UPI00369927A0
MTTFGAYLAAHRQDDRTYLKCIGLCLRRRPREEFRETPWHGRAAACVRCETFPGPAGRSIWQIEQEERVYRELEQAREKLRTYQRYAARLKAERYLPQRVILGMDQQTHTDAFRAHMRPWERVMEARRRKWAPLVEEALSKAHTQSEEEV